MATRLEPSGAGALRAVLVRGGPASLSAALRPGEVRMRYSQAKDAALVLTVENRLGEWVHYDALAVNLARAAPPRPACAA